MCKVGVNLSGDVTHDLAKRRSRALVFLVLCGEIQNKPNPAILCYVASNSPGAAEAQ